MKVKASWILLGVLGILLLLGTAWAVQGVQRPGDEPSGPPMMRMRGMTGGGMGEELNLSDEQPQQLHALMLEARKSGLRTRTDLRIKRMELEELLQADEPNQAAIDQAVRQLADLQQASLKQRIERRLAMRRLLTPEQRAKLKQLRDRRGFQFRQHRREGFFDQREQRGRRGFGRERDFGFDPGAGPDDDFDPDLDDAPPGLPL